MTASKTSAAKKTTAKKTAAKKTAAKKAAAPQVAPKSADPVPETPAPETPTVTPDPVVATADPSGAQPEDSKSSTSIAQEILDGSNRYGTGRDRRFLLAKAGHDPDEVLKELSRLRGKARRDAQA